MQKMAPGVEAGTVGERRAGGECGRGNGAGRGERSAGHGRGVGQKAENRDRDRSGATRGGFKWWRLEQEQGVEMETEWEH